MLINYNEGGIEGEKKRSEPQPTMIRKEGKRESNVENGGSRKGRGGVSERKEKKKETALFT